MIFKLTRSIVVFVTSKSVVIHLHKMYPSKYLDKTFIVEWLLRDWLISMKLKHIEICMLIGPSVIPFPFQSTKIGWCRCQVVP